MMVAASIGNDGVAAMSRRPSQDLEGEEKEERCYVDVVWLISVLW